MKTNVAKLLSIAVVFLFTATIASAQYWGDQPYDEQQWWNPADWGASTSNYSAWDYSNYWSDSDWYGTEATGAASGYEYDYGYGTNLGDYNYDVYQGTFDDNWGFDWNDEFDYGL